MGEKVEKMTVRELIWMLESYPHDLRVVVSGYEDDFDDITPERISVVRIQLDVGTEDWEGRHEKLELLRKGAPNTGDIVDALVFHQASN